MWERVAIVMGMAMVVRPLMGKNSYFFLLVVLKMASPISPIFSPRVFSPPPFSGKIDVEILWLTAKILNFNRKKEKKKTEGRSTK